MASTIILVLSALVALNFLLLIFSCNKTPRKLVSNTPKVLLTEKKITISSESFEDQLAPTGS